MDEKILNNRLLNIFSNLLRVGIVDDIDEKKGMVRVTFPDRDNLVVSELSMLSFEQNYPNIKDTVLCLFLPNGIQEGFCLGRYFSEMNLPPILDRDYFVKEIDESLTIKYHKPTKELTIDAPGGVTLNAIGKIVLNAPQGVSIAGDLEVSGTIKGQVVG